MMWSEFGEPLRPIGPATNWSSAWDSSQDKSTVKWGLTPKKDEQRSDWDADFSPSVERSVIGGSGDGIKESNTAASNWKTAFKASKSLLNAVRQLRDGTERTRKPDSWRTFSQVSVAGIDATMDRRSPLLRRILWGAVLVVCTGLMVYQCLDRVARYLDEPVNVNVRITHNDTLEFPSITVCNKSPFNMTAALERLISAEVLPPTATIAQANVSMLVGVDGMKSSEVWQFLRLKKDIFIAECWFGRGIKCDQNGEWTNVETVIGPCFTYKLRDNQVKAVGTFHNLFLRVEETLPKMPKADQGLRVLLHEPDDSPVLLARTHSMSAELAWSREVKLELRKFDSLSTSKDPCNNDPHYSEAKCHFDCFQRAMYDVSKCRMPYMSLEMQPSNISECSNPADYEEAMREVNNLLFMGEWSVHHCACEHECFETTYQAYPENMIFKPNETRVRIFYEDLVFEQITEEMAYPMISLLCDIGGTLGLLMGASVLTVCELLEVVWSVFIRTCCRLKERQPPQSKQRWKHAVSKMQDEDTTSSGLKQVALAAANRSREKSQQHPFAAFP